MRRLPLLASLLAAAALGPASAAAAPAVVAALPLGATPGQLAAGPDGTVWVALDGAPHDLARVTPDGAVTALDVAGVSAPVGVAAGSDGAVWMTQRGAVARITPSVPGVATVVAVPELTAPTGLVAGADGALWTASGDRALRVAPSGAVTAFPVAGMDARAVAVGGDGRVYLADTARGRVVALDPRTGRATSRPAYGEPRQLAAGPGGQVAFTVAGPPQLGRMWRAGAPAMTAVSGSDPLGVAFGGDGAYWVADPAGDRLLRLTVGGRPSELRGFAPGSRPSYLSAGADGTLWVALAGADGLARVDGVQAPIVDDEPPAVTAIRARRTVRRGRPWRMRLRLSEPATLGVNWWSGRDVVAFQKIRADAGRVVVRLGGRRLRPGPHRVTIAARDAAGNLAQVDALRLRVLPQRR